MKVHSKAYVFIQREGATGWKFLYVQTFAQIHTRVVSLKSLVGDAVTARYADLSAGRFYEKIPELGWYRDNFVPFGIEVFFRYTKIFKGVKR
jgi:hypothetical protein